MTNQTPFHPGEQQAQRRFNTDWNDTRSTRLARIIGHAISDEQALFIEGLAFFFLATADNAGNCDCSFKGSEPGPTGTVQAAWVETPHRLWFPDYAGNKLYNSLGNILENPHAGLIFIDFASQTRLRVNGSAQVRTESGPWQHHWPSAPRAVAIDVEQVYWNCSKRIPNLKP